MNATPGLTMIPPEATYLGWVNAGGLDVENPAEFFFNAGLGFSPGIDFGEQQFVRINFGCTAALLEEAIIRLQTAVQRR